MLPITRYKNCLRFETPQMFTLEFLEHKTSISTGKHLKINALIAIKFSA